MLISVYFMKITSDNLNKIINQLKQQDNREGYHDSASVNNYYQYLILTIFSFILFLIEFMLLFYVIKIALTCPESNHEKFIHVFLAVFFTIPYAFFTIFFGDKQCITNMFKKEKPSENSSVSEVEVDFNF